MLDESLGIRADMDFVFIWGLSLCGLRALQKGEFGFFHEMRDGEPARLAAVPRPSYRRLSLLGVGRGCSGQRCPGRGGHVGVLGGRGSPPSVLGAHWPGRCEADFSSFTQTCRLFTSISVKWECWAVAIIRIEKGS